MSFVFHHKSIAVVSILTFSILLQSMNQVYAWDFYLDVNPSIRYVFPGYSTTFTVYTGLSTGPAQTVQLMIDPYTVDLLGFTFTWTPSSTGVPPFTRILTVTVSSGKAPGTYSIPITGYSLPVGWRPHGVQLVVLSSAAATDWALSNPIMNPVSPRVGDPVQFSVSLSALSTNMGYPQNVRISAALDGVPLVSYYSLSFPGPTGIISTVHTGSPWTATDGYHSLVWTIDPTPYEYYDGNRYNNQAVLSFTVSPAPPSFDFSLSVSPVSQQVTAGISVSYSIVVTLVSGSPQPVSLSLAGLPSGASYTFSPASSYPTYSSTLAISATAATPPGVYPLTLTAIGGGTMETSSFSLEVAPAPEKDFTITVAPTSSSVEQGGVATYTITINAVAGFVSPVEFSVTGLPNGATGEFTSKSVMLGTSSTLQIKISRSTATGAYGITVTASGGGKTHDTTIGLTVTKSTTISFFEMLMENQYIILILVLVLIIFGLLIALIVRR